MAKRKIEIIHEARDENEFNSLLKRNQQTLICAEIYCNFVGPCIALDYLLQRMKLDWSSGEMIVIRISADEVEAFERFRGHSEPVMMFILCKRVTIVLRGVNSIKITDVAKQEIKMWRQFQKNGGHIDKPTYSLDEVTPFEEKWINYLNKERDNEMASILAKRTKRQAARKFHRAQVLVPHLENVNFVLFWPHALHAHPELYELWGQNDIVMIAREEILFTKEKAEDVLYQSNAESLNEASLSVLLSGKALAICFRLLDNENHFVSLIRKILYEDLPPIDENVPAKERPPQITAFNKYKSYSKSKEEILKQRKEAKIRKKEEELEKRAMRLAEMQRLAREAIAEALETKKKNREQLKLELLRAGKLDELDQLNKEPEDDDVDIEIPEELPDDFEWESSEEENEDEHFPPAGLLVPGFYSPPNDIAKCNGLALLFPKIVMDYVKPLPEFLPEHVLVMLMIKCRYDAIALMKTHTEAVLNVGIFKAMSSPKKAVHLAYTVQQYEAMSLELEDEDIKYCIMVSTAKDSLLLKLMDLSPVYVSRDTITGEDDCAMLFSVDYGDNYPNLYEDFQDEVPCEAEEEETKDSL